MGYKPTIIFDTNAINRLAGEQDSSAVLAGLRSGFLVRVMTNNFYEMAATSSPERRTQLISFATTLSCIGECIFPFIGATVGSVVRRERGSPY